MRIVIDMQGAQSESRFRGIGRYSLSLALAIARNAGQHEIWLLLNGALRESIADIRRDFAGLVPPERIRVFDAPAPVAEIEAANVWRTRAGELIREQALADLRPDAVLVTSLFEGYVDDAVVSVGALAGAERTAVILYDLIPMLNPAKYLPTQRQREYYDGKIRSLKNAGLLLAISDYSRQEGLDTLGLDPESVVSISTAVDAGFHPRAVTPDEARALHARFGIVRPMVMCAPGGFDARKNIDGLIAAWALLPRALRERHQLVIASKVNERDREHFTALARNAGLAADEFVMTGYVDDEDLCRLYSTCALFVFPSRHEGFGLPALEAMACGAPVIGSNATSVPEVIGSDDALFDPHSPGAIAARIAEVLSDPARQEALRRHGARQAAKFSWDASARRALAAIEARLPAPSRVVPLRTAAAKPRLAFVSPMPPERTGIANYSVELLPALMAHYDIELIVEQPSLALPPALAALPSQSAAWFADNAHRYDRIVYQFGNSPFHSHMFGLLRRHPGTVVLHDFFLSGALAYEETTGRMPGVWTEALYRSHGWRAVAERHGEAGIEHAKRIYPCNLDVLQDARGLIVHSEYSRKLARQWYGPDAGNDWAVIPHLRTPAGAIDRAGSRRALGVDDDVFVVCSFGFVDPTKLSLRLLDAWLASALRDDTRCMLVFVGENHGGDYGRTLKARIEEHGLQERVRITGWVDDAAYNLWLQAADASVQLRTMSRGETSGAVLHCLNHGLPTIVNANGSMADLADDAVWKLADEFDDGDLAAALETLRDCEARRATLAAAARTLIATRHAPEECARMYADAIEAAHAAGHPGRQSLAQAIAAVPGLPEDDDALQPVALAMARSMRERPVLRQLLVDVSATARNDLQTGIERVVRAQLLELLKAPPAGFRVEPVMLTDEGGRWHYRYARAYACKLLGIAAPVLPDAAVDVDAGDVFYSPDLHPGAVIAAARAGLYADWRRRGIGVGFLIHDILPITHPQFFPDGAGDMHARWLECIAGEADRLVCISRAVADDTRAWLMSRNHPAAGTLRFDVVHHGADIAASAPSAGLPADADRIVRQIGAATSFLMVGTIEPRKGHLQVLDAFERLWRDGADAQLVIVGKEGWKQLPAEQRRTIPRIVERLTGHPEAGRRLFWLQGISDEFLQRVYAASACLIAASEGEGFGLPLIEAAQVGKPIVARDIPVFREVAQQHAFYFDGMDGDSLAAALKEWLALHAAGKAPDSAGMPWRTWADNAAHLAGVLTDAPEAGLRDAA